MKNQYSKKTVDIWGGIECSFNRVNDTYNDQLDRAGHYIRNDDLPRISKLGIKVMRYPVIWEKHCPEPHTPVLWTFTEQRLNQLRELRIEPIAGLVHHGSGPVYASFYNGTFEKGLAKFAAEVAAKFPWIKYYTPVNEPLTTARFCGLYGHWYPHGRTDHEFLQILISECKGTVLAMKAIRKINPLAKLVQTEDLGKTHSTPALQYQADFENHRRWLSFDLLCGRVNSKHPLWEYLIQNGVTHKQLAFFQKNPCPPSIIGINHYLTSERFIDEDLQSYPNHTWGENHFQQYADVEAVRVNKCSLAGPYNLLKEAWERYRLPMAVTEVHLHCTREEQLRWFIQVWKDANKLKLLGIDIRAITAWAIFGSFDWCTLLTRQENCYEPGLFDVRSPVPRPTALTKLVHSLLHNQNFDHPVLDEEGWWKRPCRIIYNSGKSPVNVICKPKNTKPILITGKSGTLGNAFARICSLRGLHYHLLSREDLDITKPDAIGSALKKYSPWAVINTAGYVRVDEAETDQDNCFAVNSEAPKNLSSACAKHEIKFVTFSSDLVFNGQKGNPYLESDLVSPLNIYGKSKALAEEHVLSNNPTALIVRTSAFFGPWDKYNFVSQALYALKNSMEFKAATDVTVSPTYVPDLVNTTLDLLLDDENGIWNISNKGEVSWAMLAEEIAKTSGFTRRSFRTIPISEMGLVAPRPAYSVLKSEKGFDLPSLDNALHRYFSEQELFKR